MASPYGNEDNWWLSDPNPNNNNNAYNVNNDGNVNDNNNVDNNNGIAPGSTEEARHVDEAEWDFRTLG